MLLLLILQVKCQCYTQSFICIDKIPNIYKKCVINTTDYNSISDNINKCSIGRYEKLEIQITQGHVKININLPENIIKLKISNPNGVDNVSVEVFNIHGYIRSMSLYGDNIHIKQQDFFCHFTNLLELQAEKLIFINPPTFTQNIYLERIIINQSVMLNQTDRVIDNTFVGGLTKLKVLIWKRGRITGILDNSFSRIGRLNILDLTDNCIKEITDSSFDGLQSLTYLGLSSNTITKVYITALTGLTNLKILDLANNPTFPLDSITPVWSLERVIISHYNATYLRPHPFQQLPNLAIIELDYIQFPCDCSNQWISQLHVYEIGITKIGSYCLNQEKQVDDTTLYTVCGNNTYTCFNHSQSCPAVEDWRVDYRDKCFCCQVNTSAIYSIDTGDCHQLCNNIEGSYYCSCMDGQSIFIENYCEVINEDKFWEVNTVIFAEQNLFLLLLLLTVISFLMIVLILIFLLVMVINKYKRMLRIAESMQRNNVISLVQRSNSHVMKELDIASYDSEYHQIIAEREYEWITYKRANTDVVYSNTKDDQIDQSVTALSTQNIYLP
ncbi:hypothetical protein LOD99_479 [Oopsacas minuta]|uniref:Uncharacterized protein n=1 Tax=Oopsacas minuta TaxID=111878 RepID=A0AAV7KA78_9METZ|nr:hypothetical protein LOD99_479 [Oopsacas minuta]